jgi:Xaa-Pro aminopeptidase
MGPSPEEIASRHEKLRAAMDGAGLDAVLVGEKYNYWYLTGHHTREIEKVMRPMLFLLPREGDPAAIVYRQQGAKIRAGVPNVQLYDYEDLPFDVGLVEAALRDRGLEAGTLGLELGDNQRLGLPYNDLQQVLSAFPELRIADGGGLLETLRLHKTDYEIGRLREVMAMSLRAYESVIATFAPGQSERDFAVAMSVELCKQGTDFDVAGHVTTATSRGSKDVPLQIGDTIWCDFGATLDGYQGDVGRRAVIGEPTEEHLAVHRRVADLQARTLEAVRAGVYASDIARACSAAMVETGLDPLTGRKRIGHGLGLNPGEGPSLGMMDDTVLEPGMVICVEPRFFLPSGEKVHIEDVIVVTENGYDPISTGGGELFVIAA